MKNHTVVRKQDTRLPVTLLSGFLGSGKTTLLQNILTNKKKLKCAVIVNDMAALNIDASLVNKSSILQREEKLVEMQNGCICCTLREDLLEEVARLAQEKKFDYLIIESTGISEPMQVAETFAMTSDDLAAVGFQNPVGSTQSLDSVSRLDTCVTVVDAMNFFQNFEIAQFLGQKFDDAHPEDERTVTDLMIDQIEFADVILLNKIDCVDKETVQKICSVLKQLNPSAKVIRTTHSRVHPAEILNTGRFNFALASQAPGWLQSLKQRHVPETEEYGIGSFVYRARRPFHPKRFFDTIASCFLVAEEPGLDDQDEHQEGAEEAEDDMEEASEISEIEEIEEEIEEETEDEPQQVEDTTVEMERSETNGLAIDQHEAKARLEVKRGGPFKNLLRSKGFIWIATRPKNMGEWSQAGLMLTIGNGGNWFCELPQSMWPTEPKTIAAIKRDFEGDIGDKRNELVLIGQFDDANDQKALSDLLDSCLCSDEEMKLVNAGDFDQFEDPFEDWEHFAEEA